MPDTPCEKFNNEIKLILIQYLGNWIHKYLIGSIAQFIRYLLSGTECTVGERWPASSRGVERVRWEVAGASGAASTAPARGALGVGVVLSVYKHFQDQPTGLAPTF